MIEQELLLAISELLDKKMSACLTPIENRLKRIEVDLLENNVIPRLNTIEACYTSTYERYKDGAVRLEGLYADVDIMKHIIMEHSTKLQNII